jgi:3-deoxy-manno-octulosonate cytidylyltransferase (CMP-KDO synthetase)
MAKVVNMLKERERMAMKIVAVIPARYKSSRFEGKPLAGILGKPMIWWVYNQVKKVDEINEVYVATDDNKIKSVCEKYSMNVVMTSKKHKTGTDRVAEVSEKIPADLYLNVQGDEPMIEPETIKAAIGPFLSNKDSTMVSNLFTRIKDGVEVVNFTIPKVVVSDKNIGVFLSRSPIPYPKGRIDYNYYKQVCVYGFTKDALQFFASSKRGKIEEIEDIEILRFIENGWNVQYVEVDSDTVAVDTPNDLEKVIKIMNGKKSEPL